jgi:eukaryotic-like serine/threonine-protein kinase
MSGNPSLNLLVVGADPKRLQWILHHVTSHWASAHVASLQPADGPTLIASLGDPAPDVIIYAVQFAQGGDAERDLHAIRSLLRRHPAQALIVLADGGDELWAVKTIKAGARDYLPVRRISRDLLLEAVNAALEANIAAAHVTSSAAIEPASAALMSKAPLLQIPGYEGIKAIATSNFSAVFLARSERLKKNVVVKVMQRSKHIRGQEDADRFEREYHIISSIKHRAIVEIYDFGAHQEQMFLAMEYFPCGDLRDRLRNPLSKDDSLYYLRTIAEALRVIHTFGVLHRDLKPANVMLRDDNSPVLIDFGLARRETEDAAATGLGQILGSPYYMSPEQSLAKRVDPRTDIYSLGVMLYEMLTGVKPYTGRSAVAIMSQHSESPVPTLPAEFARLQPLLDRLMAKNPDERFRSAEALLLELGDLEAAAA